MVLWRFSRYPSLEGRGGMLASGRWHTRGRAIVYCAPNPATAVLEVLVHSAAEHAAALGDFQFVKIEVPDQVAAAQVEESQLPPDWAARIDWSRAWGDRWLREGSSALLWVRSVLVPETYNALLNPQHPEAAGIRLLSAFPYPLDARLLRPSDH